jgi:tetraacyldisaccharide 4'-kinase
MDVPIYFLRIQIDILQGQDKWDAMIDRICGLGAPQPRPEWGDVL